MACPSVTGFVGFLLANEQTILEKHGARYFVPLVWAQSAINLAKKEGRIKEDIGSQKLFVVRRVKAQIPLCRFPRDVRDKSATNP